MTKKHRLNLRINDEFKKRLDRLKKRLDAESDAEVVRRSLVFTEKMIEAVRNGELVYSKDGTENKIDLI